jgi:di/tricarboxylate transporter
VNDGALNSQPEKIRAFRVVRHVAGAMESTGTADLIARFLMDTVAQGRTVFGLALILVITMFLTRPDE